MADTPTPSADRIAPDVDLRRLRTAPWPHRNAPDDNRQKKTDSLRTNFLRIDLH